MGSMQIQPVRSVDVERLASLRRKWVTTTGYDPHSVYAPWSDSDALAGEFAAADAGIVLRDDDQIRGYGRIVSWAETDGTVVWLLDTCSAPGAGRAQIDERLLHHLEGLVRQEPITEPTVLGANAEGTDRVRSVVLARLGYALELEMHELELRHQSTRQEFPAGVALREVGRADAVAVAKLTADNWAASRARLCVDDGLA